MNELIKIECELLQACLHDSDLLDELEQSLSFRLLSQSARELLGVIVRLKEKGVLNENALNACLSEDFKQSDFYFEFIAALPNANIKALAHIYKHKLTLIKQKQIAEKLLRASEANELLDLEVLGKELDFEQDELMNLNEWLKLYENKPKNLQFKTGVSFLDSCLNGGIELAQLILIGGDPEAGKTRLGVQILQNIAKHRAAAFFCFEFTIEQYLKSLENTKLNFNANNLYLIDEGYSISAIASHIKSLYKKGVRVFLIDSQMRITSEQGRNMEEEESLKFSTLARLAHSLKIAIFLIVQNSKGDKENPMGSKKGGHEASIIIRIERIKPEKNDFLQVDNEFDENKRLIIVQKNKQTGKHFKEKVFFSTKDLCFYALEQQSTPMQEVSFKELERELSED